MKISKGYAEHVQQCVSEWHTPVNHNWPMPSLMQITSKLAYENLMEK